MKNELSIGVVSSISFSLLCALALAAGAYTLMTFVLTRLPNPFCKRKATKCFWNTMTYGLGILYAGIFGSIYTLGISLKAVDVLLVAVSGAAGLALSAYSTYMFWNNAERQSKEKGTSFIREVFEESCKVQLIVFIFLLSYGLLFTRLGY